MSWSTDQTLLAGGSHWVSFCHTVGVRTPQKHLGVGKAIGNGKKIKTVSSKELPEGGKGFKDSIIWLKPPTVPAEGSSSYQNALTGEGRRQTDAIKATQSFPKHSWQQE